MKAYLQFWRKYVDFAGKTSRSEYWLAFIIHMVMSAVLMISFPVIIMFAFSLDVEAAILGFRIFGSLYGAFWLIPFAAMTMRRLRDAGYSAKSLYWLLIPGIGMVAILARLFTKSAE